MSAETAAVATDDTLCAEHRDGKPGDPHDWRRGRRGRTVLVTCRPLSEGGPDA